MKDKHTPGPWIVAEDQVGDDDGNTIADVTLFNEWNTTEGIVTKEMPWEANARLIAAAPEMKAKLDEMAEFLRIVYVCIPEEITGTCARQITNWEMLKAKIEGNE